MGPELKPRPIQTQVKHRILADYLETWGGIILSGLRSRHPHNLHFIYVDCFSYMGRYRGDNAKPLGKRTADVAYGSPIIGVRALDALADHAGRSGRNLRTNAILIERDPRIYQRLLETLAEAGFRARAVQTTDFHALADGQIAVVNGDSMQLVDRLLGFSSGNNRFAFYLLDPWGASGIPYRFVERIITQPRHDVMINFMYADLVRKAGMALKTDPSPAEQQVIDYWTEVFGDDQWKKIAQDASDPTKHCRFLEEVLSGIGIEGALDATPLTRGETRQLKEWKFMRAYGDLLAATDPSLAVKFIDLLYPNKNRTMFYLYLTTHDPTGALALNKVLYDAKLLEYDLRFQLELERKHPQQPPLFDTGPQDTYSQARPAIQEAAELVSQLCEGITATRREVYRRMANTLLFAGEVDSALRLLRRQGKAQFDGTLTHNTRIAFSRD